MENFTPADKHEERLKLLKDEMKKLAKRVTTMHDAVTFENELMVTLTLDQAEAIIDNAGWKSVLQSMKVAPKWQPLQKRMQQVNEDTFWTVGLKSTDRFNSIEAATSHAENWCKDNLNKDYYVMRAERVVSCAVQLSVKEIR